MEQKLLTKNYGTRSRIFVALLIAFGSRSIVGYNAFLDWCVTLLLAFSIIFEDVKWAEYTCWAAIVGKIGSVFASLSKMNLSIDELFSFGTMRELNGYLSDPLVNDELGEAIRTAQVAYIVSIVTIFLLLAYITCLVVLYILIPCYLGRHYTGRGGVVYSTILLVWSIVFFLGALLLAIGYSYLLSVADGVGINGYNLNIGVSFFVLLGLKLVCLPLGTRLYFKKCRAYPNIERKSFFKKHVVSNSQKGALDSVPSHENQVKSLYDKELRYCGHCGKEIMSEAVICPHCGCPTENYKGIQEQDVPSTGLNVLSFLIPLAGLVIYLIDRERMPQRARAAGKWALIGMVVCVVLVLLYTILTGALIASLY